MMTMTTFCLFVWFGVQAQCPSCISTWIFNKRAVSMHATLVHRWHLHIIEDLINDDNQDDGQQPGCWISTCYLFVRSRVQALWPSWRFIFNNRAASKHAALVYRWHLHIIEDLIDDDDQERFICLFDLGFRVCSVQSGYSTTGLHLCMPP